MEVAQKLHFDACDIQDEELNISCRTNSSGYDVEDILDSSAEDFGCSPLLHPRKLSFSDTMDCSENETNQTVPLNNNKTPVINVTGPAGIRIPNRECSQKMSMACSPPYKRVRALRLFDSPATPKTLMEKSAMHTPLPSKCTRLFSLEKPRACTYQNKTDRPAANVNPFTPNGMLLTARKRTRSKRSLNGSPDIQIPKFDLADSEDSDNEVEQATKRVALQDSNIPRYHQEFHELGLIGTGEFGSVYKCINRLDGCTYAIKKSIKPVAGSINEKNALNEVYAHAVLGKHQHVVRYYSAWAEDNHMIIQNEYCNGGSLADAISSLQREKKHFTEAELRQLLLHVAEGLRYIHSMQLVHMDIKPGNIFISKEKRLLAVNYDSADDGFDEEETVEEEITYKIGDLGHVTSISNPQVEEGDCRYLPTEILREDFGHLPKADIFALGLTVYEAGGGGPLPKNGPEWHDIRNGNLKELSHYSRDLNDLLKLMIHPNPEMRPSAICLIQHRVLCPFGNKTKAQLRRELNAEKLKNEILSKQLQEAAKCLKTIAPNVAAINSTMAGGGYKLRPTPTRTSSRVIGKKVNRSNICRHSVIMKIIIDTKGEAECLKRTRRNDLLRRYGFVLLMLLCMMLASIQPHFGGTNGIINGNILIQYLAVPLIYLEAGIRSNPKSLYSTLTNGYLLMFMMLFTYVLMPCVMKVGTCLLTYMTVNTWLLKGMEVLYCMPPPFGTSLVLCRLAEADLPTSVVTTIVCHFGGLFISPILLYFVLGASTPSLMGVHITEAIYSTVIPLTDASSLQATDVLLCVLIACVGQLFVSCLCWILCSRWLPRDILLAALFTSTHKSVGLGGWILRSAYHGSAHGPAVNLPLSILPVAQLLLGSLLASWSSP
ncbi:hypothetical protein KM043_001397 [Ampulex compressa]|nr:hypothetical protein KM043_001397 [Ampulex compressa]